MLTWKEFYSLIAHATLVILNQLEFVKLLDIYRVVCILKRVLKEDGKGFMSIQVDWRKQSE